MLSVGNLIPSVKGSLNILRDGTPMRKFKHEQNQTCKRQPQRRNMAPTCESHGESVTEVAWYSYQYSTRFDIVSQDRRLSHPSQARLEGKNRNSSTSSGHGSYPSGMAWGCRPNVWVVDDEAHKISSEPSLASSLAIILYEEPAENTPRGESQLQSLPRYAIAKVHSARVPLAYDGGEPVSTCIRCGEHQRVLAGLNSSGWNDSRGASRGALVTVHASR